MKLAEVSVRRPVFAAMMIAAMIVFGILAYPRMGVDLFPNVDFPIVTVSAVYPGADPETMEEQVAEPIEEALQTLSGIDRMMSQNFENVSQVIVQFELDVDGDLALQDVRDKVSGVQGQLPSSVEPPLIAKFDIGSAPIMALAVSGELTPAELYELADDVVKQRVERIAGVGGVELLGGQDREIKILVDPVKLGFYGLTVEDVSSAITAQSLDLPAGPIQRGDREFTVKTRGEVRNVADVADLVIPGPPGRIVRVGDVADVVDGLEQARSLSRLSGESAIALFVRKQAGANTVEVAERVREAVEDLRVQVEDRGAELAIPIDNSVFVEHAISDLQFDIILGAALTVLIIFVFLNDGRATLISALALPTSVVGTFAVMNLLDFTFNNMTMLALSLSIGILVDDAIVVIENIHRHMEMGKGRRKAALEATQEIGFAVIATTMSFVAVFVPVAIMEGIIGRFFFQFGITVAAAVLLSMFVSFSLTPLLSSRILKMAHEARKGRFARGVDRVLDGLASVYARVLAWSLRHVVVTLALATAAFVGAVGLLTQVKSEFLPPEDRAQLAINIELPTGTALEATGRVVGAVERDILANMPAVEHTLATVGDARGSQVNSGRIEVMFVPSKQRNWSQREGMAWVRERYADADIDLTVEEIPPVSQSGQSNAPIQFVLKGRDLEQLERTAAVMVAELREIEGFVDVDTNAPPARPELAIEVDRERAADLGVSVAAIARVLRSVIAGDTIGELRSPEGTADITLQMPEHLRADIETLPNLKVRAATGQLIDLASVAEVVRSDAPSQINRLDRQRQITITANLEGLALGDAQALVEELANEHVPETIDTAFIGSVEIMMDSFKNMIVALVLAVVIVYMILAAQFDSFIQPLAIMFSLPLSFIGAFGALYLGGMTLNIFSMIGLIMLMGLVTKNAILLVDFTNAARANGSEIVQALVEAGRIRLRPILMTTTATIFGMLPVALAMSEGGEARAPMATAVIGGLITSTLLTLVVVPVVYLLFERLTTSRAARWLWYNLGMSEEAGQ